MCLKACREVAFELDSELSDSAGEGRGQWIPLEAAYQSCHTLPCATGSPTLSYQLALRVREVGITVLAAVAPGAHESAAGVAVVASKFVSQAQDKRVGFPDEAPSRAGGGGLLAAQGGHQRPERRIWKLIKNHLEARVPPDLEAEIKTAHQGCWQGPRPLGTRWSPGWAPLVSRGLPQGPELLSVEGSA